LHVFRGHEKTDPGFVMGHEFVGTVVEAGAAVQAVKVGDKVVTPFTTSW
jgi:threonine dehydrogenase-like Zn-dependent dehydrogenase